MKERVCRLLFLMIVIFFTQPGFAAPALNVAIQWSPVFYQMDKSDGLTAQQNIFTLVNFDRDWRLNNNWYNLLFYPLDRMMYYSVVESDTHYFIGYYQYYPRHIGGGDHEHDMTGALLAVSKTPDGLGRLDMLVTYSNNRWEKWNGAQVQLEAGHPSLTISAATHAIAASGKSSRVLRTDGIREISSTANLLAKGNNMVLSGGAYTGYRLIPLTQLWDHRQEIGQGRVFARWGYFDSYNAITVTAPWVWDYCQINWLAKPGEFIQCFKGIPVKACAYLSNPYQSK
ncbi:MAG TPA: hypothetical protein VGL27_11670 [Negativicutes bacterium]